MSLARLVHHLFHTQPTRDLLGGSRHAAAARKLRYIERPPPDDPEDAMITQVSSIGAAIALIPMLLMTLAYYLWPELFFNYTTQN